MGPFYLDSGYLAGGDSLETKQVKPAIDVPLRRLPVDVSLKLSCERASALDEVREVVLSYANTRGLGEDLVVSELVKRGLSVAGVVDVVVVEPLENIAVADDEVVSLSPSALIVH